MKYTTLLFCLLSLVGFPQDIIQEMGKITREELMMKSYAKDPDAEALIIFDKGQADIVRQDDGPEIIFKRITRIKIFNKAGYDYGEVSVPFYQENQIWEKVDDIEAYTYNMENGEVKKTALDLSTVYTKKVTDAWNEKVFALPNVKDGSIIEYRYTLTTPHLYNLPDWEFQWRIPVINSEYSVEMNPFYEYTYLLQGVSKLDIYETYKGKVYNLPGMSYNSNTVDQTVFVFGLKEVPAFRDEAFITSASDHIIKLDFQLSKIRRLDGTEFEIITTWEKLINNLDTHNSFGDYADTAEKLAKKEILPQLDLNDLNDMQKAEVLVNYVKQNFKWNRYNAKYSSQTARQFLKEKTGNSADINLFLTGLLRAADVKAYPIILSTRKHGKIFFDYPFSHYFNYTAVLLIANGKYITTDGTNPLYPFTMMPARCINDRALIVNKGSQEWIGLTPKASMVQTQMNLAIKPATDSVSASITKQYRGYDAVNMRQNYGDDHDKLVSALEEKGYPAVELLETNNFSEIKKAYSIDYSIETTVERIGSSIFLSPFLNEITMENPLKYESRKYPIDMVYPQGNFFQASFVLPENYVLKEKPDRVVLNNEDISIFFEITTTDNEVTANASYTFKHAVYPPEKYEQLKSYFNTLVYVFNTRLEIVPVAQMGG